MRFQLVCAADELAADEHLRPGAAAGNRAQRARGDVLAEADLVKVTLGTCLPSKLLALGSMIIPLVVSGPLWAEGETLAKISPLPGNALCDSAQSDVPQRRIRKLWSASRK